MNLIREITFNDIKLSTIHYVESTQTTNRKFTKVKNLKTYFTVVSDFLGYLHNDIKLINDDFFVKLGAVNKWPKEVNVIIFEVAEKTGLSSQKDSSPILEDDEYKEINNKCDDFWKLYKDKAFANYYNSNRYEALISGLLIKLYLHTGISCEKVPLIKTYDLSINCEILRIGNYEIHLTEEISQQLREYLIIRNENLKILEIKNNKLFISSNGSSVFCSHSLSKPDLVNQIICSSLGTHSTSSYLSLVKYSIIEMIKQNLSVDSIERLTGHGSTIIKSCYDYVYELDKLGQIEYVKEKFILICQKNKF